MIFAQDRHRHLWLGGFGKGGEAAQVAEDDRDLATVALEEGLVARRDDQVGDLRREESLQPPHPVDLGDLFLDPLLELSVPLGELGRLLPNGVVILLDSDQRTYSREQLSLVERLQHEVVGPSLERFHLLLAAARRDHHDGKERRRRCGANTSTHLIPVESGHHDVEQHQIGQGLFSQLLDGLLSRTDRVDRVSARAQHGVQQADVLRRVVHDQYAWRRIGHTPTALGAM